MNKNCDIYTNTINNVNTTINDMSKDNKIFKGKILYERVWSNEEGKRLNELYFKQYRYLNQK